VGQWGESETWWVAANPSQYVEKKQMKNSRYTLNDPGQVNAADLVNASSEIVALQRPAGLAIGRGLHFFLGLLVLSLWLLGWPLSSVTGNEPASATPTGASSASHATSMRRVISDELGSVVHHVAVPKSNLPSDVDRVWVADAQGQRYLAQVGSAWLLDGSEPGSGDAAAESTSWLTFVAPQPAKGDSWQLTVLADQVPKAAETRWVDGQSPLQGASYELQYNEKPLLQLMGQAFEDSTAERRDETYKVFHHLWMPGGTQPITKGAGGLFPHHRGLFMGWNRIGLTQGGKQAEVDTWHARKAHQRLVRERSRESGPVFGRQVLEIEWVNEAIQPPQPFLREIREIVVVPVAGQVSVHFSARLESLAGPIRLAGDPQHAGFQFRASQHVADVSKGETYYLRPDGIAAPGEFRNWPDKKDHINLPFHGMSFVIDGQRLTCARLEHPGNPGEDRFSERDYGRFGSYFEHDLTEEEPLEVRYQLRVVPGELTLDTLKDWHRHFVEPVPVEWNTPSTPQAIESAMLEAPRFPQDWAEALRRLRPLTSAAVFQGREGAWDAALRERGWVLHDGQQFRMYYTGYDGQRSSPKYLGMAVSQDGLAWDRRSDRPVLADHWVEDMMVVPTEDGYYMVAEGQQDVAHAFQSFDGRDWRSVGPLDIRTKDGQPIAAGPRGTPTVFRGDGTWYLLYERRDQGIWLAASLDRQVWTNVQDDPVMGLGDRDYDQAMIALNQIWPCDGGYLGMFHSSSDRVPPRRWVCGAAFSPDLRHWVKMDQPLTELDSNESSGILVQGPNDLFFMTMHDQVKVYAVEGPH
jgi:hypothetical protein